MDLFSLKIRKYLDRLADSSKKPNSFLFVGPEGTGKEEAAYYFISKLAGKDGDIDFKRKIRDKIHPDVVIVEPEIEEKKGKKREKNIGISQVAYARERLKFFPYELEKKFCLITHANRLNREASNALLKVLEEPSTDTYFILLSSSFDLVLPTIQSRCAAFRFSPMPEKEFFIWMKGQKIPDDNAEKIWLWSGGKIKLAQELLEKKDLLQEKENRRQKLRKIFAEDICQKFEYIEEKSKDRNEIISILEDWEALTGESIRKIMSEKWKDGAKEKSRQQIQKLLLFLEELRKTTSRIRETNANSRTACEKLVLEMEWK
jgi:DNA polymerase III subunit delta'